MLERLFLAFSKASLKFTTQVPSCSLATQSLLVLECVLRGSSRSRTLRTIRKGEHAAPNLTQTPDSELLLGVYTRFVRLCKTLNLFSSSNCLFSLKASIQVDTGVYICMSLIERSSIVRSTVTEYSGKRPRLCPPSSQHTYTIRSANEFLQWVWRVAAAT